MRCPALTTPKDPKKKLKKKKNCSLLDIDKISSKTMLDVLYYIYTGNVEFSKLTSNQILSVYSAAIELSLPRLCWLVENYFRNTLNIENVFGIIKGSHLMNHKTIKEFSVYYAVKNYISFTSNKEGVRDLGPELFQEITDLYNQSTISEIKSPILSNEPLNTIKEDYKSIYDTMPLFDAVFLVNGEQIKCHKAFLSAVSDELASICSQSPIKTKEGEFYSVPPAKVKEGHILAPMLSSDGFKTLLKYLYYEEENISARSAIELIPYSKDFGITDLLNICERIVVTNINQDTALLILSASYMDQMSDRETVARQLKKLCIDFILANLDLVDLSDLKLLNPDISIDILLAQQAIEKGANGSSADLKLKSDLSLPDLKIPSLH